MIDAKFTIDLSQVRGLPSEVHDGFRNGVFRAVQLVRTYVKEESPKVTGNLSDSIFVVMEEFGSVFTGRVIVNPKSADGKPYALFVAEGTGIFGPTGNRIYPKSASALRWISEGGGLMIRKSVAGQKPNPFHERGLARAEPHISEEIEKGLVAI